MTGERGAAIAIAIEIYGVRCNGDKKYEREVSTHTLCLCNLHHRQCREWQNHFPGACSWEAGWAAPWRVWSRNSPRGGNASAITDDGLFTFFQEEICFGCLGC